MPARGPTTPRRRPTTTPAAERSSTARLPPRCSAWRASRSICALPAVRQRACRGLRDDDALGRRCGRPGVDGVGLPGLPGPHGRGRTPSLGRGCSGAVAAAARDPRRGARARRPVHRRAPRLARFGPQADGALRRDRRRHEPGARRRRRAARSAPGPSPRSSSRCGCARSTRSGIPSRRAAGMLPASRLQSAELFRLDNPYWNDDPAVFARGYVQSVLAWGGPLMSRAFSLEGEDRAPVSSTTSSRRWRSVSRLIPTAIAGTTSRPSSSAGRPTAASTTGHGPRPDPRSHPGILTGGPWAARRRQAPCRAHRAGRHAVDNADRNDKLDLAAGEPCILLQPNRVYRLWRKW